MPMTIYNRFIKRLGVFVIPIFIITNFGPMYVLGILPKVYAVYSVLAIFIFGGIAVLIWRAALKRYASASS